MRHPSLDRAPREPGSCATRAGIVRHPVVQLRGAGASEPLDGAPARWEAPTGDDCATGRLIDARTVQESRRVAQGRRGVMVAG